MESLPRYQLLISMLVYTLLQLAIAFWYHSPVDVEVQYLAAIDILHGGTLYVDIAAHGTLPEPTYPPVYLYYLALLFSILGPSMTVLKLQLVVVNLLQALLSYHLATELWNERAGLVILWLNIVSPINYAMVYAGFFDNFVLLFLLLAIYLVLRQQPHDLLAGIMLGISIMSKQFGLVLIPLFLLYLIHDFPRLTRFTIGLLGSLFLIALPFLSKARFYSYLFYHLTDNRASLSLFFYLLPSFDPYAIFIQVFAYLLVLILLVKRYLRGVLPIFPRPFLIWAIHLVFLVFLLFNRIVYPHYVPYFSFLLPFILVMVYRQDSIKVYLNLLCYGSTLLATLPYALAWQRLGNSQADADKSEFVFYSLWFNLSLAALLIHSLICYRAFSPLPDAEDE